MSPGGTPRMEESATVDRHSVAPAPLTSGPRGELGVAKFSHSRVSDARQCSSRSKRGTTSVLAWRWSWRTEPSGDLIERIARLRMVACAAPCPERRRQCRGRAADNGSLRRVAAHLFTFRMIGDYTQGQISYPPSSSGRRHNLSQVRVRLSAGANEIRTSGPY